MAREIKNRQELEAILEEELSFSRRAVTEAGFYLKHPYYILAFIGFLDATLEKVDKYYQKVYDQKMEELKPKQYGFDF